MGIGQLRVDCTTPAALIPEFLSLTQPSGRSRVEAVEGVKGLSYLLDQQAGVIPHSGQTPLRLPVMEYPQLTQRPARLRRHRRIAPAPTATGTIAGSSAISHSGMITA
jgi:hypothetical protein